MRVLIATSADVSNPFSGLAVQLKGLLGFFGSRGDQSLVLLWSIPALRPPFTTSSFSALNAKAKDDKPLISPVFDQPGVQFMPSPYSQCPCEIRLSHVNHVLESESCDFVIFLQDAAQGFNYDQPAVLMRPSICWTPVYHEPRHPQLQKAAQHFGRLVAVSPHCAEVLGLADYLPPFCLGFSSSGRRGNRKRARKQRKIAIDKFVILLVIGANCERNPRKALEVSSIAYKGFHKKHPNSLLYVQCTPQSAPTTQTVFSQIDLIPASWKLSYESLSQSEMISLYQMSDVTLYCPSSSGFATVALESQVCGTRVLSVRFGCLPDYVHMGTQTAPLQKVFDVMSGGFMVIPSVQEVTAALAQLYRQKEPPTGDKYDFDTQETARRLGQLIAGLNRSNESLK